MNSHQSFQRFAAMAGIVSFAFSLISNILQGIPVHFSSDMISNPTIILGIGAGGANLMRWGLILDMLGYYLPLLPIAVFIQYWFEAKKPIWVRFYTICGFGYVLIGATGAVVLAALMQPMIGAYAQASAEQRIVLETIFGTIWNIVYGGLWNILGELLIGIWFFGVGLLLRNERRFLGFFGMVVGISALLDSLGNILSLDGLALLGLSVFLLLAPIWALWFGIDLLRKTVQIQTVDG